MLYSKTYFDYSKPLSDSLTNTPQAMLVTIPS